MSDRVKVNWYPRRQFVPELHRNIGKRLDAAAMLLQGHLIGAFKQGNVTGKTPSSAGQIPAVVTGRLKGSINVDSPNKFVRRVGSALRPQNGSTASYAIFLEFGTRRMAPRPWLRRGLDAKRDAIRRIMGAR